MAYLQLQDIRKRFGEAQIIRGVDLAIERGEFIVFVGPSGCGVGDEGTFAESGLLQPGKASETASALNRISDSTVCTVTAVSEMACSSKVSGTAWWQPSQPDPCSSKSCVLITL